MLRGLLAGEEVTWDGAPIRMTWPARSIPIVFASSGPKSLALAGRVADVVLFQVGASPGMVRYALGHIERGAAERDGAAGRPLRLMRLACSVAHDRQAARSAAFGYAAAAAGTVFRSTPRQALPDDLGRTSRR